MEKSARKVDDYRVVIKLQNNALLQRIEDQCGSMRAFCKEFDLGYDEVNALVNLKRSPIHIDREWRKMALLLAVALRTPKEELFPLDFRWAPLDDNTAEISFSQEAPLDFEKVAQVMRDALRQSGAKEDCQT